MDDGGHQARILRLDTLDRRPQLRRSSNTNRTRGQLGLCHAREVQGANVGFHCSWMRSQSIMPRGPGHRLEACRRASESIDDRRRAIPCRLPDPTPAAELPLSTCRRRRRRICWRDTIVVHASDHLRIPRSDRVLHACALFHAGKHLNCTSTRTAASIC